MYACCYVSWLFSPVVCSVCGVERGGGGLCINVSLSASGYFNDIKKLASVNAIRKINYYYIPRRKSGIYWIQVRRAAAAAEISLCTR